MKAVVLETRNGEAAVLVNDGTVRIVRGVYNVGEIIDYRLRPRFVQWIAAAAAMLILVGGSTAMWIDRNYVTYAEVSLDVNPSIIYSLNKRDRVLDVRAVNDDAESIVKALEQEGVRFTPLSEAVEKTMSILDNQGYMDESTDDYVLINVSADNEGRQKRLSDEVETGMTATLEQNHTIEYRIDHSDRKTAREADKAGMSAGRYAAWQRDEGASDIKDYADKPVRELVDHNPDEDQRDSEAKPAVVPSDDPQTPPSDEAKDQVPSSPMQEEADADAPSGVQSPVENPAGDTPSSEKNPWINQPLAYLPTLLPTHRAQRRNTLLTLTPAHRNRWNRTEYPRSSQAPKMLRPRKGSNPTRNMIHLPMEKRGPIIPTLEAGNQTGRITVPKHPNHMAQTNPLHVTQIQVPGDNLTLRPSLFQGWADFFSPTPFFLYNQPKTMVKAKNLQGSFQNQLLLFHHRAGNRAHSPWIIQSILKG